MQKLSTINRNKIVGEWVFEYIRYFAQRKMVPGQKVLLKIEHMSAEYIKSIVSTIDFNKQQMPGNLEVILKTIQAVDDFEALQTKENETIVWLRNNIAPNQIVILVLNEERPEGQSLKDAVAVDETALLSVDGFRVLEQLLHRLNYLDISQVESLTRFIECYQSVTDMQLSTLVDFIVEVIQASDSDINVRIANAYPALGMFKELEVNMNNKASFITKLRKNHNLSSLRKSMSQLLDIDRLIVSAEKFLKTERENQYMSNIWNVYKKNDEAMFKQDVEDFLYRKNKNLLQIQYADVEKIFNFKESHKLKDKLLLFQESVQEEYDLRIQQAATTVEKEDLSQQKLMDNIDIINGIEAVEEAKDLEAIRKFREKFEDQLNVKDLTKKIQRVENKLENPSIYKDFIQAVLTESLTLLQEIENEDFKGELTFELKIVNVHNFNEEFVDMLNFHLNLLNTFIDRLNVQLLTMDHESDEVPEKLLFELSLHVKAAEVDIVEKTRFTLDCLLLNRDYTSFYEFAKAIQNQEHLGYREVIDNMSNRYQFEPTLDKLEKNIRINGNGEALQHIQYFRDFQENYEKIVYKLLNAEYEKTLFEEVEQLVKNFLKHSYEDIKIVRDIYGLLNQIASVQFLDNPNVISSYKLSVLNPIRLLGYMSRFIRLNEVFAEHLSTQFYRNRILEVTDLKKYREYLLAKLGDVPPAYITNSNTQGWYFLDSDNLGEGTYRLDDANVNASDKADIFANEVQRVTNEYLKVYPFAKDSLNVLFMYVSNEQYIIQSIDKIFKNTDVEKLNISVYSKGQASTLYRHLNQWIQTREEYLIPLKHLGGLPKVEINIIPYDADGNMLQRIQASLSDYDLAFFVNFLNHSAHSTMQLTYIETEITPCEFSDPQWAIFEEIGYINSQGGSRHINYVSDNLPEVLADFYELQYMINRATKREKTNHIQLLKSEITPADNEQNRLYDEMHNLFNWVVAYDKYIDPLFAQQITKQAEIIKYSIVQKSTQNIKLLISSSESVNRLLKETDNYYYHDRLANRLMSLLGIQYLSDEIKEDIVQKTKKLSGASVLKSLGPGKFTNELLSIYLTVSREQQQQDEDESIHVWFSCDELAWFRTKSKRPDLLHLIIHPNVEEKVFTITFRVIELKLVNRDSYNTESEDAQIQLNAGVETLKKTFDWEADQLDKIQGHESFFEHLMQNRAYTPDELQYMKNLRIGSDWEIADFIFEKQADVYMYSHDNAFPDKMQVDVGYYKDDYNGLTLNTFTRSYILNALKVNQGEAVNEVENEILLDFDTHFKQTASELGIELEVEEIEEKEIEQPTYLKEAEKIVVVEEQEDEKLAANNEEVKIESDKQNIITVKEALYPEEIALSDAPHQSEPLSERMKKAELVSENYKRLLEQSFRENNVQLRIFSEIIGANVIRMQGTIPRTEKASSITSKTKEMGLWLKVPTQPIVSVAENIIIDISRVDPDTIYFNEFMQLLREQLSLEEIKEKAVVPIGLNPLNEVMYMDLNDSIAHLLVAGTTGSGKSVSLNSIVLSMMCLYSPQELRFVFVDPKQVEFSIYQNARHTDKVITGLEETADYLESLAIDMDYRYTLFSKSFAKNITSYNEQCIEDGRADECLSRKIVVFDEFADFMLQDKDVAERITSVIKRLGQKSRAAGIHLIICTQTPKADVIDTSIRNNLSGRLCLRVADANASNVVLDESGAELLAGKGDYLMKGNNNKIERGMSPFLDDRTQRTLLKYFSE